MGAELTLIHWFYVFFIISIIGFMLFRRDTTVVSIIGIIVISFVASHSLSHSVTSVFNSFIFAITEWMLRTT